LFISVLGLVYQTIAGKMTGYEPIELRKLMRERLYYFNRARNTKGSVKKKWKGVLKDKEEVIKEYVTNPYIPVKQKWRDKALEQLDKTEEI